MPLGLGLGITKLKSLVSGLRVRFQGNATITAALDGILRDLSADFVSNGTVTAALEAIKLLDVDFSGNGTLTANIASFTGLLDDYPNAAAAYSVRLLKSDYTGALVRIRKDTAGQPEKDFYPDENNELSLNSSDGGTTLGSWIGSNDGYVVTWYSQAGISGRDVTNSTAAEQPQIVSGGALNSINSKPALLTSGDFLSGTFSLTASTKYVFTVMRQNGTNNFIVGSSAGGSPLFGFAQNSASNSFSGFSSVSNFKNGASIGDTRADMFTEFSSQGIYTAILDSTTMSNFRLGYASSFEMPSMQEMIIYDSDESSNKTGIETNINDFFNIYS